MTDTITSESEQGRIHPLAAIARRPRYIGHPIAWLFIATVEWGTSLSGNVVILFCGLVWPHLAHWIAVSGKDTRKSGLAALAGDGVVMGLGIGILHFSTLGGIFVVTILSVMTLLGGVPLLLRSAAWTAVGATAGFFIWGLDPGPRLVSELLLVAFVGATTLVSSWAGHRAIVTARQLRQDLENTNTERESLLEALSLSEAGLKAMFESAHDAIVTADNDGCIETWNPKAEQLFGWTEEQIRGQPFTVFLQSWQVDDIAADMRNLARGEADADGGHITEMTAVDRHGRRFPVELSVARFGARGNRTHSVFIRDISARVQADEELRQSAEQLAAAVKEAEEANQAKSLFLANMSHELRTPMNAIIGYSELLEEDAENMGLDEFQSDLQKVQSAARHLLDLINDILDLAKVEAGKVDLEIERIDLPGFCAEVAATVSLLVDADRVIFTVDRSSEVGEIDSDPTKLRQILMNLLSNAIKFTQEGSITLSIDRYTDADDRQWLSFIVSDTGIGMTQEQQERVFEAFEQADASTKREYGGTGLGLPITRSYCEMLGGSLEVRSEAGTGSSFIVTLPPSVPESSEEKIVKALADVPLLSQLPKSQLLSVARLMEPVTLPAGSELTRAGEIGKEAFLITRGSVSVWQQGMKLTARGVGASIGESSLIDRRPHSATCVADEEVDALRISANDFSTLLDSSPGVARKIMETLTWTIRYHEERLGVLPHGPAEAGNLDVEDSSAPPDQRPQRLEGEPQ